MDKQSSRWRILFTCCLSVFIMGLDVTVVNIGLPAIERSLDASRSGLQWTVDAYTVVTASLLLFAGSTADRFGRKRVFLTGLTVFTAASVLCSLAPTVGTLVAFRALQAVGASMMNPVAMSIIANTFTDPRERAQAVGIWGAVFGISMALGPVVGGTLVAWAGWRCIFCINLPVGLLAIGLALRFIPESRAPRPRRFDPLGQALVIVTLAALTYGLIETSAVALAVAGAALLGLLRHEPRRAEPLVELRLFRAPPFAAAIAGSIAAFAAFGGFLFLNTLYLQGARGLSAVQAGLLTAPLALMIVLVSPLSGRIVGRRGPRLPLLLAGGCLTAASALLIGVDAATPVARLIVAYVVFGVGFGFVNAPITNAAVSGLPRAQAGVAAALATTSRQVGLTLGVALATGWWMLVACGALVLVLARVQANGRRRPTDVAADERLRARPSAPPRGDRRAGHDLRAHAGAAAARAAADVDERAREHARH